MEASSKGTGIEYDVHDLTVALAGDVMLACFFGKDLSEEKINDMSVPRFLQTIIGDLST